MTQPKLSRPRLPMNYASFKFGGGLAATSSAHQSSAASSIPTLAEPRRVAASSFISQPSGTKAALTVRADCDFQIQSPPKPHIDSLDAATDR